MTPFQAVMASTNVMRLCRFHGFIFGLAKVQNLVVQHSADFCNQTTLLVAHLNIAASKQGIW